LICHRLLTASFSLFGHITRVRHENDGMSYHGHDPDRVDWLDLGPDPDEGRTPADPRRRYVWYAGAAGLVVVALLVARTQQGPNQAAGLQSSPSRTTQSSPSHVPSSPASSGSFVDPPSTSVTVPADGLSTGPVGAVPTGPPKVTTVGHPLLDVPADWELFALGQGVLVRIQLARGRITTTPVPVSVSTDEIPAMFLVGSDRVLVRPQNDNHGYVVRDGKRPQELPEAMQGGFYLLPGPDQQHLWTNNTDGGADSTLTLVNLAGESTGVTIDVPTYAYVQGGDGTGYLLLAGIGGMYDARPGKVYRVTTGSLRASGPTRWLTVECDESLSCANVVVDRATGHRRSLPTPITSTDSSSGIISPDGKTAALMLPSDGSSSDGIQLLDLDSGAERTVQVTQKPAGSPLGPQWAWSPDSRWLFVADASGRVIIVNRGTGRATPLGTKLVQVNQLALRHRSG
jgi:hypothetical protein